MEKGTYGYSKDGYRDHTDCIHKAWPWDRLTQMEREYVDRLIEAARPTGDDINYEQGWDKAAEVWEASLILIGYKSMGWREPTNEDEINKAVEKKVRPIIEKAIKDVMSVYPKQ